MIWIILIGLALMAIAVPVTLKLQQWLLKFENPKLIDKNIERVSLFVACDIYILISIIIIVGSSYFII